MANQAALLRRRRLKEHLAIVWSNRTVHTLYVPGDQEEIRAHDNRKLYITQEIVGRGAKL